jgi:hypothetical protein
VWLAFLSMYVFRAGALAVFLPSLLKASEDQPQPLQPQS